MTESPGEKAYTAVQNQPNFPAIEHAVLEKWANEHTFERSISQREHGNEFVFYDGPPFANGLPHYGHLLTSFVKDTVPRYRTMKGYKVDRRFGWDCHGLPVEMEVERQLGFSGKAAITDYGLGKFNEHCRESVMRYANEWESTVSRAARWVDFENDYKTMDLPYMESVMWAFKTLYKKGLMYEGRRVLPYCWECETPLSNFETRLDDAYRERQDHAVTVLFALRDFQWDASPTPFDGTYHMLAWTTTPWTLPSNLALAVGNDIDYAIFEEEGRRYIIGAATVAKYKQQLQHANHIGVIKGSALVDKRYVPLFPYFSENKNAFHVVSGAFVNTDDGTGVVHMAPYGEDDWAVLHAHDIEVATPVDLRGVFTDEVPDFAGTHVFDANPQIVNYLKAAGALVKREQITHSYPHCWRSDTPLLYMPLSSWFVKVTAIKDRMVARNQEISWVPEHVRDGAFGKWLEGARDWSISRNRFWGSPIPVWKSDDPKYPRVDVYGSLDELEADFGVRPDNLHRPFIDQLTRPNPDDPTGQSTMRRVEDVLDCWFESGSMPFAQVHYPFENKEWFDTHFPGDFIVEYIAQTRGWFYTLHVLSTALFDRPPFLNCLAHGVVLGEDGRKASKKLRNYPDPAEVFETVGADACRFALYQATILRGGDAPVGRKMLFEAGRTTLVPIWNAWYFLTLYANTDNMRGRWRTDQSSVLDRYIIAKTAELRDSITRSLDTYELSDATRLLTRFVDVLNNWWIRRSRDRFWRHVEPGIEDRDKQDAYDTLHTVMTTIMQLAAPLIPMISEHIYCELTGEESVHLTDWPDEHALPHDAKLVAAMDLVRDVCSEVLSIRKAQRLRVRLPLAKLTIAAPHAEVLRPFLDLIADEVNVKTVELRNDPDSLGRYQLSCNPGVIGPRIGQGVQQVLAAARRGDWKQNDDGTVCAGGETLYENEFELRFLPSDENSSRSLPGNTGVVVLDINPTPELENEGAARDLVRLIQSLRRDANLIVTDRIVVTVVAGTKNTDAFRTQLDYVASQTLAQHIDVVAAFDETTAEFYETSGDVREENVTVRLQRVTQ